jgi:hypothetical protein
MDGARSFEKATLAEFLASHAPSTPLPPDPTLRTKAAKAARDDVLSVILRSFRKAELCLEPCEVPTPGHPGLHVYSSEQAMLMGEEEGKPACALPRAVRHGFHMCYPGHVGLYVRCGVCFAVVPVRAEKRHAEAHLGINRTNPKVLAAERRTKVATAVRAWMKARPDWGKVTTAVLSYSGRDRLSLVYLAHRFAEALEQGKDGGFWKNMMRREAERLGLERPPTGVKEVV